MRVIEKEMNIALDEWVSHWKKDNTEVFNSGKSAEIYLYGNHIASRLINGETLVNVETLKQYPTNTTLSRLRALGVDVSKRKGKIILCGKEV